MKLLVTLLESQSNILLHRNIITIILKIYHGNGSQTQMHLNCVFLDQKLKIVISDQYLDGFSKNMVAIKQHAIVEKKSR